MDPFPSFFIQALEAASTVTTPVPFPQSVGAMLLMVIVDLALAGLLLGLGVVTVTLAFFSRRKIDEPRQALPGSEVRWIEVPEAGETGSSELSEKQSTEKRPPSRKAS